MKRKLIYAAGFILIAMSVTTCTKNCMTCSQNTYDSSNTLLTTGSETEYCDASLIAIKATQDVTVGNVTTKWVCR